MEHKGSAPVHKRAPATCAHDALSATPAASECAHAYASRLRATLGPCTCFRHPHAARGIHLSRECDPLLCIPLAFALRSLPQPDRSPSRIPISRRCDREICEIKAARHWLLSTHHLSSDRRWSSSRKFFFHSER